MPSIPPKTVKSVPISKSGNSGIVAPDNAIIKIIIGLINNKMFSFKEKKYNFLNLKSNYINWLEFFK